jgi:AcrR family transcriptional regulator
MGIQERREREFLRREREILDGAHYLFAGDSWHSVTVEQIAERAEIGKGTIYKHFNSKDEIYARLWMDFFGEMVDRLRTVDPTLDVASRLRAVVAHVWEQHQERKDYHRIIDYCERVDFMAGLGEATRARMQAIDAEMNGIIFSIVQEGVEQGLFPRRPPEELVFGPRAALIGAIRLVWSGCLSDVPEPERFLDELTNFMLAGMMYQDQVRLPADALA